MKRTRLSAEARREQLLDVAKQTIIQNGLQHFSLRQLAVDAGVSEPLLFHYFSSRIDLLQQLLSRDYGRHLDALKNSLDDAKDLQDVLKVYVSRNFDHHTEDGVIDILLAEPEINVAVQGRRNTHLKEREKFLVGTIASEYDVSRKKAAMLALMASAASMAAASFASEAKVDRNDAIETVIRFITQGFESGSV